MFGVEYLTLKDGVWHIVGDGGGYGQSLEQRWYPFYIAREDGWYEIEYGPTDADSGNWMAQGFDPGSKAFTLEEGMAVKYFGGDLGYSSYNLEPTGRCVCTLSVRGDDGYKHPVTKLALDLKHPPFAAHHWPLGEDGVFRPVEKIDLTYDRQNHELTEEFFGEIDEELWFWLILI